MQANNTLKILALAVISLNTTPALSEDDIVTMGWIVITELNENNRISVESYQDNQGQPQVDENGAHLKYYRYDTNGNITEKFLFGLQGEPTADEYGVHRWTSHYDADGHLIEFTPYAADGSVVINPEKDVLHKTKHYNQLGYKDEVAFWGKNAEAVMNRHGIHRFTIEYDEHGNEIARNYYGLDEQPVLNRYGVHRATYSYDEQDHRLSVAYFGIHGEPVVNALHGYHLQQSHYTPEGLLEADFHYGVHGEAILNSSGFHVVRMQYDRNGNRIEVSYFDTQGRAVSRKVSESYSDEAFYRVGVARAIYTYDDDNNMLSARFYNPIGQLIENAHGVAVMNYTQDSSEASCYNLQAQAVPCEKSFE